MDDIEWTSQLLRKVLHCVPKAQSMPGIWKHHNGCPLYCFARSVTIALGGHLEIHPNHVLNKQTCVSMLSLDNNPTTQWRRLSRFLYFCFLVCFYITYRCLPLSLHQLRSLRLRMLRWLFNEIQSGLISNKMLKENIFRK